MTSCDESNLVCVCVCVSHFVHIQVRGDTVYDNYLTHRRVSPAFYIYTACKNACLCSVHNAQPV